MKAATKDILRTIRKHLKRLIALIVITVLGLTAFTGINASCKDMYIGADRFYDQQHMFDVRVQSTLGLTDDDIEDLAALDEVEDVSGSYTETVDIVENGQNHKADITVLNEQGINEPYVVDGHLPRESGQLAVTQKYLDETGKALGDKVRIEEDLDETEDEGGEESEPLIEEDAESPHFPRNEFTITALVLDPLDISSTQGTAAFRSSATADYTFFITEGDVATDVYTDIYLRLSGLADLDCYSEEYENAVAQAVSTIETKIKDQREQARYDSITDEALGKISDAERTMNEEFAKAEAEIADARAEIEEGKQKIRDGEAELVANEQELNSNAQKLEDGKRQLAQKRDEAKQGFAQAETAFSGEQAKLDEALAQANAGKSQMQEVLKDKKVAGAWKDLVSAATASAAGLAAQNPGVALDPAQVAAATTNQQNALAAALTAAGLSPQDIQSGIKAGIGLGIATGGQQALDQQRSAYESQKAEALAQLDAAAAELAANESKLQEGRIQIANARATLEQSKADIAAGEAELVENEATYHAEKLDAETQIADAYAELEDIERPQWYVQSRSSNDSYSSLDSDLSSVRAIGTAFPILFLIVGVLISLTTMTRMVEEERSLIGTYKALGFSNSAIAKKYFVYALIASVAGSVLGCLIGFFVLPVVLLEILKFIYTIPDVPLFFDISYALIGSSLFIVSTMIAAGLACKNELKETPAALMRPKAPRQGARIFLERIPFIWKNLKFLNKVTARNLFRYKKRFFMTLIGIAGCTALVLMGFGIRDSVTEMRPKQYDEIYTYDMMAVSYPDDNDRLTALMDGSDEVADYINVQAESIKIINEEGASETLQMVVVPTGSSMTPYIHTIDTRGGDAALSENKVLLTQNAAQLLAIDEDEAFTIQNMELERASVVTDGIVKNYLGNTLFITQELYEKHFGAYEPNAVYVHLNDTAHDHIAYAESLLDEDFVLSSVSTAGLKDRFMSDFVVLNYVIYILAALAAGLAFVVLFTLCSTNISERIREIATIKVLGFYDKEVHSYVNKETMALTAISVLCGLPLGTGFTWLLLAALQMPSIFFELHIEPLSYVLAGIISFGFTFIVNLMTNRVLDKVNMVEALKSVE